MKVDIEEAKKAKAVIDSLPPLFCKECGETDPEGGFYPLWSLGPGDLTGNTCNPCMEKWRQREQDN